MGQVRNSTANQRDAARRSAEARRCPDCGRKSALVRLQGWISSGQVTTYCRWEDCGYERRKP